MSPTVGQIVLYKLGPNDAEAIRQRRAALKELGNGLTPNPFVYGGNEARAGQEYPAVVVCVFSPSESGTANLQVLLDGHDTYWATSRYNVDSASVRQQIAAGNEFFRDGQACYRIPEPTA